MERKVAVMKRILAALSLLALLAFGFAGCGNEAVIDESAAAAETEKETEKETEAETEAEATAEEELQDYIDLELVDKDGNPVRISDYEGKFIALNFFGIWCKFCMEEMPDLEKVYSEYEGDDFVILLVNATTTEKAGKDAVIEWYEEEGWTMPMVLDLDGKALDTYPVSGFPTTYFINKQGKVLGALPSIHLLFRQRRSCTCSRKGC